MTHRASIAGLVMLGMSFAAGRAHADPVAAHPSFAGGFAFAAVGYEGYAFAPDGRVGVDLIFDDERSHELALSIQWTGLAIPGARLDMVPAVAAWRWVPAPEVGFYTLLGAGAGVAIDSFDAQLGARRLSRVEARAALEVVGAIGILLFEHVDLEVIYRQAILAGALVDGLGTIGVRLGGRI